jgi:hypothetical protein
MKRKDINIDDALKQHLAVASLKETLAAQERVRAELQREMKELREELRAKGLTVDDRSNWPGELEPIVLAATFVLGGKGDLAKIVVAANKFAAEKISVHTVRSTLFRLVRRQLVAESNRQFTVTDEGKKALALAKASAKRWIEAMEL